jgi:hypothetical protein
MRSELFGELGVTMEYNPNLFCIGIERSDFYIGCRKAYINDLFFHKKSRAHLLYIFVK